MTNQEMTAIKIAQQIYYSEDKTSAYLDLSDFEDDDQDEAKSVADQFLEGYEYIQTEADGRAIWHKLHPCYCGHTTDCDCAEE